MRRDPRRPNPRIWYGLALVGALAAGTATAAPRWTPVGPPAAPMAARLIFDTGGKAFALTDAGLWRSQSASSWGSIQLGLDGTPRAFAADPRRPGRIYASVTGFDEVNSIRRSDDFGDHWSVVAPNVDTRYWYPQDLLVDPFAPDTLYLMAGEFLQRSRDAGRTWECFPVLLGCVGPVITVDAFTLSPDRPGTLYAFSDNNFYRTTDGGATWSQSTVFENEYPPEALVATRGSRTLYAWTRSPSYRGDLTPCFVRSDDEGATWTAHLSHVKCGAPAVDVNDPLTIRIVVVVNNVPQLQLSRDGGETWSTAGTVPELGDLYVVPGQGLVLATDLGVFRASGDQGPWRPANRGFAAAEINAIAVTQEAVLAAPVQPGYSPKPPAVPLVLTEDSGRTWQGSPLINPIALAADPGNPHRLIASAFRYEDWGVRHSRVLETVDDGHTWRGVVDPQVELSYDVFTTLAFDPFDPRILYAGNQFGGFQRSVNSGRTWEGANIGLRFGGCHHYYCDTNHVSAILPDPKKNGTIAILFERQVYVSEDGGSNWQIRGPVPRQRLGLIRKLVREPGGALVALQDDIQSYQYLSLGIVYRSMDEGVTWKRIGRLPSLPPLGRVLEVSSFVATPSGLFAGTNYIGVLRSTDGGRTWKSLSSGLPIPAVSTLTTDPSDSTRLYATVPRNGVYTIQVP